MTVQIESESSLVTEVKENQDSDLVLLELKGAVHQQRVEFFSQGGDGVLPIRVDYLFLTWEG